MSELSELTPDHPLIVFYKYYSFFTLTVCWMGAPLVFYVILTQSKSLGKFKWIILNHTVWSMCSETLMGVIKPVILSPVLGGYQVGLLAESTTYKSSSFTTAMCFVFTTNSIFGMAMALFSRYTIIFPSKWQHLFFKKETYFAIVGIHLLFDSIVIATVYSASELTEKQLKIDPLIYAPELKTFVNYPTWYCIDPSTYRKYLLLTALTLTVVYLGFFVVTGTFIYQCYVNGKTSNISNKLQKSLVISSVMHVALTASLLMSPMFFLAIFISFDLKNTGKATVILFCMYCTHCMADFVATMVIISPYKKWFLKALKIEKGRNNVLIGNNSRVQHSSSNER